MQNLDGRTVTIPNSKISDTSVENISSEASRKVSVNLGLTYDMDEAKVKRAMEVLHEIADEHKEDIEENLSVGFNQFGDFALNVVQLEDCFPVVVQLKPRLQVWHVPSAELTRCREPVQGVEPDRFDVVIDVITKQPEQRIELRAQQARGREMSVSSREGSFSTIEGLPPEFERVLEVWELLEGEHIHGDELDALDVVPEPTSP